MSAAARAKRYGHQHNMYVVISALPQLLFLKKIAALQTLLSRLLEEIFLRSVYTASIWWISSKQKSFHSFLFKTDCINICWPNLWTSREEAERTSWGWVEHVNDVQKDVGERHIQLAYRLHYPTHVDPQCKKNCPKNPKCYCALGRLEKDEILGFWC